MGVTVSLEEATQVLGHQLGALLHP
jgi:hypothetical protein